MQYGSDVSPQHGRNQGWGRGLSVVFGLLLAGSVGCYGSIADPEPEEIVPGVGDPGGSGSSGNGSAGNAGGGGASPATGVCKSGTAPASTPARIWRLSDEQIHAAVSDLLPGMSMPSVTTTGRAKSEFINMSELFPVDGALAVDLRSAARAVATEAVKTLSTRLGCAPGQDDKACATAFLERFTARAFRRPLDDDDRDALAVLFDAGAATSTADGVRLVIEGVLQSPSFLYRSELAGGVAAGGTADLAPHELASALSFFLLDSIPDEPLWGAALDGSLARADVREAQIKRLIQLPRARANLARVFLKWTGLGAGVTTELASEDYPLYDDAMKQSLGEEATRFLTDLLDNGGTVKDLLTSRKTFVDQRLAGLYGVAYSGGGDFTTTTLPAGERSGLLTLGSLIVSKSHGFPVVHRGKWIRKELLCTDIPSPPPGLNTQPPASTNLTSRQFAEFRLGDGTCGACHQLMDRLGLAFEGYDALGRYATKDKAGNAIDTSGEITGSDVDGKVNGAVELAQRLAGSQQVRLCIESKMMAYALGRDIGGDSDTCEVQRLDGEVAAAGGRLSDVMTAIARSPAFRARNGGQ